jgi:GT2 family glycosyltransferase
VGGFDRTWRNSGGEDRALCLQWRNAGHRLLLDPGARVHHEDELTFGRFLLLHLRYGVGAWLVHRWLGATFERPRYYLWLLAARYFGRGGHASHRGLVAGDR